MVQSIDWIHKPPHRYIAVERLKSISQGMIYHNVCHSLKTLIAKIKYSLNIQRSSLNWQTRASLMQNLNLCGLIQERKFEEEWLELFIKNQNPCERQWTLTEHGYL